MFTAPGLATRFRLQAVLDALDVSQSEAARRSGVSYVTVNAIANNRTTRVDLATLDALSRALGVPPGDFLEQSADE